MIRRAVLALSFAAALSMGAAPAAFAAEAPPPVTAQ